MSNYVDKGKIHTAGEVEGMRLHHTTQNGAQFEFAT